MVDVQNCFVDGGTLPVKGGDAGRAGDQQARGRVREHRGHAGLAHAGPRLVRSARMPARSRSRRPSSPTARRCCGPTTACRARDDAALHKDLKLPTAELIIRKGFHKDADSYSAFIEADGKTTTGLAGYLKARGVDTVFVTGLATDFCVAWTALDARKLGFKAYVIEDATRAIDLNGSLEAAWKQMTEGRRQADPVERHRRRLSASRWQRVAQPFACRRAAQ